MPAPLIVRTQWVLPRASISGADASRRARQPAGHAPVEGTSGFRHWSLADGAIRRRSPCRSVGTVPRQSSSTKPREW